MTTIIKDQDIIDLACDLISKQSVTPEDAGCQNLIIDQLQSFGFKTEKINCGAVSNLLLRKGNESPVLAFAGHTDVVPAGDISLWKTAPFEPIIKNNILYGRGAADMKGSIAAIVVACQRFLSKNSQHKGSIALLITSDEEGAAKDGTVKIMEQLQNRQEFIDYCIVGEPTSSKFVGDTIKIGRRGSLHGYLTIHGTQGHIAYPQYADNPIHKVGKLINILTKEVWDNGNNYFDPTQFQIWNIASNSKISNVIPSYIELAFNFRYSSELTATAIKQRVTNILDNLNIEYNISWDLSGEPFLTTKTTLIETVTAAIDEINGAKPVLSTTGGTSDGRFIAPTGTEVIELGPANFNIHKPNESVAIKELLSLARIYEKIINKLLLF